MSTPVAKKRRRKKAKAVVVKKTEKPADAMPGNQSKPKRPSSSTSSFRPPSVTFRHFLRGLTIISRIDGLWQHVRGRNSTHSTSWWRDWRRKRLQRWVEERNAWMIMNLNPKLLSTVNLQYSSYRYAKKGVTVKALSTVSVRSAQKLNYCDKTWWNFSLQIVSSQKKGDNSLCKLYPLKKWW